MLGAVDSTAIYVALIGGITTITTGALALFGVWITSRNQVQTTKKDELIASLEHRLDDLEQRAQVPPPEGAP